MIRLSGGAKEESAAQAGSSSRLDAEGRKANIGFYYDDEVRRTDTPGFIRLLAPYIDGFNWAATLLMYTLPLSCKCMCGAVTGQGFWAGFEQGPTAACVVIHSLCAGFFGKIHSPLPISIHQSINPTIYNTKSKSRPRVPALHGALADMEAGGLHRDS